MESIIVLSEIITNKERKFGSQLEYFPCEIKQEDGICLHALFTKEQIFTATERANRNPEDIPENKTFWDSIF
jgi:hypothetical protein